MRSVVDSVLVANRGEIALRVTRACREMGLRSVAVYSDADRWSPHVLAADEAYRLGPAPASESYLAVDRILEVAEKSRAAAVHPGYGFLAERAGFARAVEDAGLVFIGPTSTTIAAMGDKTEARRRMRDAGVPVVPGTTEPAKGPDEAARAAREVGFPVVLKASAGGGGKGMRVVRSEEEVERAFEGATREAVQAFGDGAVYVEKFLANPRHVEIQLLGDADGRVVHLGERECSIQRRHQKLIEEAPSPVVDSELRDAMGQAAVRAAEAVAYLGAGTVEFLLDGRDFYFLEMNTRIQVEHPVTELVTGVDLVRWQLRIAGGETLDFSQNDVQMRGHAVECRITSEDPSQGFLPATGEIRGLTVPTGPGVRWDGGISVGMEVGLHYDPLLGKLVAHGPDRPTTLAVMKRALDELRIQGVDTCIPFHRRILEDEAFRNGEFSIQFLDQRSDLLAGSHSPNARRAAAVAGALLEEIRRNGAPGEPLESRSHDGAGPGFRRGRELSPWQRAGWPWANGG